MAEGDDAALVRLRGLTVGFPGGVAAVRGVDLDLAPGRVLSLIGESGSGKSTVLLALAGLLPAAARLAGRLEVAGVAGNVLAPGPARAGIAGRVMGMIFQNPGASLNPVLTVGNQIDEVVTVHRGLSRRAARDETLALLARCGISDARARAAAYPHQLSGGLKQRVAIAAALAGGPRLILADEPTTALDATVQAQILDLLLDLVDRDGVGLMMVTHDMGVAGAISDRLAVMYAGRIVEEGPAAAVATHPAHPYSAALAAAALPLGAAAGRPGTPFAALPPAAGPVPPGGCAFAPRCARATPRCRAEDPALAPAGATRAACFHPLAGAA
jgi:oligopeptide/dipeptide ABC transporter ATP-binding protein